MKSVSDISPLITRFSQTSSFSMDIIPPLPQSLSSTPQIRSRITVVCAECKRLKLKCDRRTPCGSCTKRDTVPRCIYSPAAAEKVDLHSLNNRLIQVEATLSLITSGQTPPMFQSSYPFSQIPTTNLPSQSSSSANDQSPSSCPKPQHHFHHHLAPPGTPNTFISVPPQDLASLWLDELERDDSPPLELKLPSNSSSVLNETNPVKLEAVPDPDLPSSAPPNASLSMHSQNLEIHAAYRQLPSLDVYYPFHPSSDSQAQPPPHAASSSYVPPQASNSGDVTAGKPYVTPALVARLPSFTRAKQLLQSAAHLLSIRPVPLPACLLSSLPEESGRDERENGKGKGKASSLLVTRWDAFECRALCLIGSRGLGAGTSSVTSDRKKRGKVGARAREIFFGNGATSTTSMMEPLARHQAEGESTKHGAEAERNEPGHTAKDRGESLPFFAAVCIVLAMGAATSDAFGEGGKGSQGSALVQSTARERHETSEFFYVLAQQALDVWEKSMTCVSPPVSKETNRNEAVNEEERLDYLIANLLVIGYQLFQSHLRIELKDAEQKRTADLNRLLPSVAKMVNMARVFGLGKAQKSSLHFKDEEPGGKSNLKEYLNDKKRGKREERRRRKEDLKRMIWWDIVSYELFISDALGHPSLLSSFPCSVKLPRGAGPPLSTDEADSDQEEDEENRGSEEANDVVEVYHGACYRLTKITQMVKHKMLYPDCCCGYTLDQAAGLEREIRRFLETLPPSLRFTALADESKEDAPQFPEADVPQRIALRMQRCTLMIMAQRLTIMVYLPFLRQHLTSSVQPDTSSGNTCNPVLHPIYHAAQSIIQALLQLGLCNGNQSHPRQVPPLLLGLYPVEKALLDAVVICTYIRTFHGPLFPGHTAADSAISGMRMLWNSTLGTECRAAFERLKTRFRVTFDSPSVYGVKRKHEQIAIRAAGYHDTESPKYSGEPSTNHPQKQLLTMQERRNASNDSAGGKRNDSTLSNVRDPETGQKDKKHAKKSHAHPSVGVRVRGKEAPFFRRSKVGSSSSAFASNIGADDRTPHCQQGLELQSTLDLMMTPMTEGKPAQSSSHVPDTPTVPPTHEPVHRSRSCSLDQDLRCQPHLQHDSPPIPPFTTQFEDRDDHLRTNNIAHVETYNHGYQQQDRHVNSIILPTSLEGGKEHEHQKASFSPAYLPGVSPITVASSPYSSSGHVTPASGSPFTASGNIVSASLGQAIVSHLPAPPSYTHAYYDMGSSNGFNAIYNQIQGQEDISYTGVRLDTAGEPSPSIVNGDPTGGMGMAATVPSPPVYEKARSTMFDAKSPMDMLVQQQMHHRYMLQHQTTYGVDQHQQDPISITDPAWTPQPAMPIDASQRYWGTPVEQFKYFHS